MKRNDLHRVGAIVPAHYRYVMSYALSSGDRQSVNLDCEAPAYDPVTLETRKPGKHGAGPCCLMNIKRNLATKWADHGTTGRCTVCGAQFVYGDVWMHEPTGEHIHIGHECAEKYQLLTDRSEFELLVGRAKDAAARVVQAKKNAEERAAFLAEHPGLVDALTFKHRIIEDIAEKFKTYRRLSDAQIALVYKIIEEEKNPKPAEVHVPAPSGRQTFRATIVSIKEHGDRYSRFGASWKMTVKVATGEGVWLGWGTVPTMHGPDGAFLFPVKGDELEVTATLEAGREAHFAFMKRPKAKIVTTAVRGPAVVQTSS